MSGMRSVGVRWTKTSYRLLQIKNTDDNGIFGLAEKLCFPSSPREFLVGYLGHSFVLCKPSVRLGGYLGRISGSGPECME